MNITSTEENYLKAIFHLIEENQQVTINELSKFLNIKMPTVNSMMKKFMDKGWVIYESYKPIKVTQEGKKQAANIVRKHRLTEMFLVTIMKFGWENVHEIAEQLEHIKSEAFFDKMDEMLDFPKMDPHGEPIPDKNGNIIAQDLKKLSEHPENQIVTLTSVTMDSEDFLSYLNNRNLTLGTTFKIIEKEKFDNSVMVKIGNKTEILSEKVCNHLLVKRNQ